MACLCVPSYNECIPHSCTEFDLLLVLGAAGGEGEEGGGAAGGERRREREARSDLGEDACSHPSPHLSRCEESLGVADIEEMRCGETFESLSAGRCGEIWGGVWYGEVWGGMGR